MKLIRFVREVRQEVSKVTWPTRQEVLTTTMMVLILVTLIALFLFAADNIFAALLNLLLGR